MVGYLVRPPLPETWWRVQSLKFYGLFLAALRPLIFLSLRCCAAWEICCTVWPGCSGAITSKRTKALDYGYGAVLRDAVFFWWNTLFPHCFGIPYTPAMLASCDTTTTGTLAFLDVGGDQMDMELPTESPTAMGENRLLQDLRQLSDNEVSLFFSIMEPAVPWWWWWWWGLSDVLVVAALAVVLLTV